MQSRREGEEEMFDISVDVNGHAISPIQLGSTLEAAVICSVKESIRKRVGFMRCMEHGKTARITVTGNHTEYLSFRVPGCCDTFIQQVTDRIEAQNGGPGGALSNYNTNVVSNKEGNTRW